MATVEKWRQAQTQGQTGATSAPGGTGVEAPYGAVQQYLNNVAQMNLTGSSSGPASERGPAGNGFSYDINGDALYQQYRDRYVQNAKRSMKDTMGQAASLTGGYGSTYGQAVGQQAYDETMRGLTDMIPQLEQNAYGKWKDQQALTQQQYSNLSAAIMNTGYMPNDDELAAAGMSKEQAAALRQAWIARNPGAAYMSGALSAENYFKLTGQYAPGTAPSGGGGGGSRKSDNEDDTDSSGKKPTRGEIHREAWNAYNQGEITYQEYRTIMAGIT